MAIKAKSKKRVKSSSISLSTRLDRLEKNQKKMLLLQEKLLKKEAIIEQDEERMLNLEHEELSEEKLVERQELEQLDELKKLEELEKKIQQDVKVNPLKKITQRDIVKGIIGAFFGIVGHFAFAKGVEISEHYTFLRSTMLLITAFVIIILFLYFAGFRKVDDKFIFRILPLRAIVIYCSAIFTIVVVLLLYGKISFETEFHIIYNTVAAISLLAILGAGTADLIGKQEE